MIGAENTGQDALAEFLGSLPVEDGTPVPILYRPDAEFAARALLRSDWLADLRRRERAAAWDEALDHVWELNDPAYTVITDTDSIHPIVTRSDVEQAKQENPYRADNLEGGEEVGGRG